MRTKAASYEIREKLNSEAKNKNGRPRTKRHSSSGDNLCGGVMLHLLKLIGPKVSAKLVWPIKREREWARNEAAYSYGAVITSTVRIVNLFFTFN